MSSSVGLSGYYMATWWEVPTLQDLAGPRIPSVSPPRAMTRAKALLKELLITPSWLQDESSSESSGSSLSVESHSSGSDDHNYSLPSSPQPGTRPLPTQLTQSLPQSTSRMNPARPRQRHHPRFHCTDCGTSYSSMSSLRQHRNIHENIRPYTCPHCPKAFNHPSTRRTHVRQHTGEQPYRCRDCPARFSDLSSYTKHKRCHSGEKPYACPFCQRRFSQSCNQKRHARSCNFRWLTPSRQKVIQHSWRWHRRARDIPFIPCIRML